MRVGVVGAGITGLALTHHLAERGVDVVAFEAAGEPGGVIRSDRVDGRVLEYGPQRVRHTGPVAALVDDLGLADRLLVADPGLPLFVYRHGALRRVPRSVRGFLRTDALSWRGKCRVLAEPLTDAGSPDELAGPLLRRKFGAEAYRALIEPLFGGIYASDPDEMPAEHALAPLLALEREHGSLLRAALGRLRDGSGVPPVSFDDGLQTLPEALYDAHRPYVHLDAPVESVRAAADGEGYRLRAGGRSADVTHVVVTAPAPAAASILGDLEGARVGVLRGLTYNSLALVHLRAGRERPGMGYQVCRDEPLRTLGVTWNAALFDRDGVHTAFLGGTTDPDALELSPSDLGEIASREFEQVTGTGAEVLEATKLPDVLPAYDESWRGLGDLELPERVRIASNYTARLGISSRIREARRLAGELAPDGAGDGPESA